MRTEALVLAVILVMTPLGAKPAAIVVWLEKGSAQEGLAVREIVAAFEQESNTSFPKPLVSASG